MKVNIALFTLIIMFTVFGCNQKSDDRPQTEMQKDKTSEITTSDSNSGNYSNSTLTAEEKIQTENNATITAGPETKDTSIAADAQKNPIVTFIELGSVSCVPCKKMQPIMKSLETKYGDQLKVIFYDVWKDEYKDKGKEYGIKLIPTQIFFDADNKEINRHEGYYSEEDIDKFLQSKGLIINN